MKEIKIANRTEVAIVDDEDFEYLSRFKWRLDNAGYAKRTISRSEKKPEDKGYNRYMHYDILPRKEGLFMDHKNHDRLDNRRENLRHCTFSQNQANAVRPVGKTGYRGVHLSGNRWQARVKKNGVDHYTKHYSTPLEAAQAYNELATNLHGDFAVLNPLPAT